MRPTPRRFIQATQTRPPFRPCLFTSHDELKDPARPPTVKIAVTKEYFWSSIPRHRGRKELDAFLSVEQVRDATGKFSSERWYPSNDISPVLRHDLFLLLPSFG